MPADYTINCMLQKNNNAITVSVAPFRQVVKERGEVTVEWQANGDGVFPAVDFFQWKSGGPGYDPQRSLDGTTLTITYDCQVTATWTYMVTMVVGNSKVIVDPDIHNDPPPGM